MLNYSAINYGAVRKPSPFTQRAYTDTLQISMKTEKPVYPIGTESVNVILTNKNLSQQFILWRILFCSTQTGRTMDTIT